ncbi:hypothetical protein KO489_05260 [Reinekea forsetii]|nr:hypothetical protein [Reinekea forsetii]
MTIVTLSSHISSLQLEFLANSLLQTDAIIATSNSFSLVYTEKPLNTQAFVRESELLQSGGKAHDSWTVITDEQWANHLITATKHIAW